jgi:hypothetical protein
VKWYGALLALFYYCKRASEFIWSLGMDFNHYRVKSINCSEIAIPYMRVIKLLCFQRSLVMIKLLFISILVFSSFTNAEEKQGDMSEIIGMMVVAKATGMCGVLSQMINFQQTTKMDGGDEFMIRFINTEAARLGKTLEVYVGDCPPIVEKYNGYMKMLGFEQ